MEQSILQKKNKVIHTWNDWEYVAVRYETPQGKIGTDKIKYPWYFCILKEDKELAIKVLDSIPVVYTIGTDKDFPNYINIYCNDIKGVQTRQSIVLALESKKIETFEGDLLNDKRWFVDHKVEISNRFKKLYYDIETDDSNGKIRLGQDRIVSIAAVDGDGKQHFIILKDFTDEAEIQLLKDFIAIASRYDILLGWSSKEFDAPYIKERMKKYKLRRDVWKKVGHFDLLKRFRHIFRFDNSLVTFSLQYIATHFLEKGKVPHTESITELWKSNKELLKEYNLEDCILIKELDEKLGVSEMMIRQCQWCGVPPSLFGLYSIIDTYIIRKAHSIHKRVRTAINAIKERDIENERGLEDPSEAPIKKGRKREAKYTGALVLPPQIGLYKKVYTFDFKGLYPSMMRTSNIGYDSLMYEDDGTCIINPGTQNSRRLKGSIKPTYFRQEPSIISLALEDLVKKRSDYKKLKLQMIEDRKNKGPEWERVVSDEIIVKEIANSTYGIMGLEYGRYFSIDVAESITLFGQWSILFAKKHFESLGHRIVYGDTDSIFVATNEEIDVQSCLDSFHAALKEELKKHRIEKTYIELAFDKEYNKFLLFAKKNYAGHVVNIEGKKTDDIYCRGLEYIKKNTFSFAKRKQKELVEKILMTTFSEKDLLDWFIQTKKEFYDTTFSKEELKITVKIGRNPQDYANPNLLNARLANDIEFETGVKMAHKELEYIITGKSILGREGVLFDKYDGVYDKDIYWTNLTEPVVSRALKVLIPDYSTKIQALEAGQAFLF
jgi:DNA polymerase elongation subunit (family B)